MTQVLSDAFKNARTLKEYNRAKARADRLPAAAVFELADAIIDARLRVWKAVA